MHAFCLFFWRHICLTIVIVTYVVCFSKVIWRHLCHSNDETCSLLADLLVYRLLELLVVHNGPHFSIAIASPVRCHNFHLWLAGILPANTHTTWQSLIECFWLYGRTCRSYRYYQKPRENQLAVSLFLMMLNYCLFGCQWWIPPREAHQEFPQEHLEWICTQNTIMNSCFIKLL